MSSVGGKRVREPCDAPLNNTRTHARTYDDQSWTKRRVGIIEENMLPISVHIRTVTHGNIRIFLGTFYVHII